MPLSPMSAAQPALVPRLVGPGPYHPSNAIRHLSVASDKSGRFAPGRSAGLRSRIPLYGPWWQLETWQRSLACVELRGAAEVVTDLVIPGGTLITLVIMAAIAGMGATLPARRAGRLNVLEAIATEQIRTGATLPSDSPIDCEATWNSNRDAAASTICRMHAVIRSESSRPDASSREEDSPPLTRSTPSTRHGDSSLMCRFSFIFV